VCGGKSVANESVLPHSYRLIDKYMRQPPRWGLKFDFHIHISLESGAFGKFSRSNWIWLCAFLENNLLVISVKIR
jgi:hypothetical protein